MALQPEGGLGGFVRCF